MSNVLPLSARNTILRDTQARVIAVSSIVIAVAACVAILALTPAFLTSAIPLLSDEAPTSLDESAALYDESLKESARTRVAIAALVPFATEKKSVQKIMARLYALRPDGVEIERMQYQSGATGQITITGLSEAREPVNDFRTALVGEGVFTNVSVPVAALVGALDGRFTMTLSGDF